MLSTRAIRAAVTRRLPRRREVLMLDTSSRGGIALYTSALVGKLRVEGVDVALTAPKARGPDAMPLAQVRWGHELDRWPQWSRRPLLAFELTRRALSAMVAVEAARPRIVHLQTGVAGPLDPWLLRWWRLRGFTIVRTVHDAVAHEDRRHARRDRELWELADVLIVHGREAADVVREASPTSEVWEIQVDLPEVIAPDPEDARRALGLDGRPIALLLGLIRPYKGIGLLAAAWPGVRARRPDAQLAVVGTVMEPFDDLERLAGTDGVDVRIGWLSDDDVLSWLAAADVCVLPYAHGVHSAVLHNAVAAGTPVIASPTLADDIERFAAGKVVRLDPEAWAVAIADALGDHRLAAPTRTVDGGQAARTAELYRQLLERIGLHAGSAMQR